MPANRFTRGSAPGRARAPHSGTFAAGHPKYGGRARGTPNAISPRARKAIAAATRRIGRGASLYRAYWDRVVINNPLISEALQRQGRFTLLGTPRFRSRAFNMQVFCKDLSAIAMREIKTDQFVHQHLVQCLVYLAIPDPNEFAKFLALPVSNQTYQAARPHAEVSAPPNDQTRSPHEHSGYGNPHRYPPEVNPGILPSKPIPQWRLGYDPALRSHAAMPFDFNLSPDDAYHEVCGMPRNPAPGWDWIFDYPANRFWPLELRPKTPIPEWTVRDDMTPVPVNCTQGEPSHRDFGSPLSPAPSWQWKLNDRIRRLVPCISDWPPHQHLRPWRLLVRWHPDKGHYSLVWAADDDIEEYAAQLFEYDPDRKEFTKRGSNPSLA